MTKTRWKWVPFDYYRGIYDNCVYSVEDWPNMLGEVDGRCRVLAKGCP